MRRAVLVLLPFALLLSCVRAPVPVEVPAPPPQSTFAERIRPILEARCVVCHACYNSPCQFNQQTYEGVDRGGTKALIYDGARLVAVPPTRMFQDAQTTAQWRSEFKFFPLVSHSGKPEDSVLHHFLTQRRADQRSGDFDMEKKNTCPDTVEATKAYFRERPEAGMPYGMPPLDDAQFKELEDWLSAGAPPPPPPAPPTPAIAAAAAKWEAFFDSDDLRGQLVARYLYEHLFLAHLYFSPTSRDFYRLVRSRTPIGQPVDEIATVRPFDDPERQARALPPGAAARDHRAQDARALRAERRQAGALPGPLLVRRLEAHRAARRTTTRWPATPSWPSPPSLRARATSSCSTTRTTWCAPSSTGRCARGRSPSTSSTSTSG